MLPSGTFLDTSSRFFSQSDPGRLRLEVELEQETHLFMTVALSLVCPSYCSID